MAGHIVAGITFAIVSVQAFLEGGALAPLYWYGLPICVALLLTGRKGGMLYTVGAVTVTAATSLRHVLAQAQPNYLDMGLRSLDFSMFLVTICLFMLLFDTGRNLVFKALEQERAATQQKEIGRAHV